MKLNITTNASQALAQLQAVQKQVRFAAASALTATAKDVQKVVPGILAKSLDRPTKFTTDNSTFIKIATRDNLEAAVLFKDTQAKYLQLQVDGGIYRPGDAGIRLPGNIQLNTFGNIPRGVIKQLKAAADNGQLSAALARRLGAGTQRRKNQRGKPLQLFFGVPRGKGWEGAPLAIWRRVEGQKGAAGKLIPVIVFEKQPARYTPRVNLQGPAEAILRQRFPANFQQALQNALATTK